MERLPYIDDHAISVDANRTDTWDALLRVMCRNPEDPIAPTGFGIDEATRPERLVLTGRHPFSIYRLVFELTVDDPHRTSLRARTWATFPGLSGRVYRALVIGTGGHRVVVRQMLKRIAAAAHPAAASALNWGTEPSELTAPLACDALARGAGTRADRAISIAAPPAIVYSWLCQLRAAPYSYDLLDNLGRRSPRHRDPGLTQLEIGQRFMTLFALHSFTEGEQITLRTEGAAVTYAVRPQPDGSRLHVRVRFGGPKIVGRLLAMGDLVMMRKQLLTLKSLAEREALEKPRIARR